MTKRAAGKFKVALNERYITPEAAVLPLIPHLHRTKVRTFVEPCCAERQLIKILEKHGFDCRMCGDIAGISGSPPDSAGWMMPAVEPMDARKWKRADFRNADACITNTPWTHELQVEIMMHQSQFVPSWFLVKSDWIFTKQSGTIMNARCTDIVPIGRVKWFPDSKSVGFDNCAWVRMTRHKYGATEFWPFQ